MNKALIGYTGLIGKNLLEETNFKYKFNSKNINKILKRRYDIVVCAAAPGKMYLANKYPNRDQKKINKLIFYLKKLKTKNFVLISTIQVFKKLDSKNNENSKMFNNNITYGKNRRKLEIFCEKNFKNYLIVRLPSVFGKFLKKNFIYDLYNPIPMMLYNERYNEILSKIPFKYKNYFKKYYYKKNNIFYLKKEINKFKKNDKNIIKLLKKHNLEASSFTNFQSSFQYYYLGNLWKDITKALNFNLKKINLACEPINAKMIYKKILKSNMKKNDSSIYRANMVTNHSKLWGSKSKYIYNKKIILNQLINFYKKN